MNPQARLGAFVLIALLLLAYATTRVGDIVLFEQKNNIVEAEFDDLLGLDLQSPVRMAGVKIGVVQEILLRDNRAIVRIALNPGVRLPASTRASIIGRGLVGEKNLALTAKAGDTEWLAEGAVIPSDPTGDINTFMAKASGITDDIRSLTHTLSIAVGEGEGFDAIQEVIASSKKAIDELTAMIQENRQDIRETSELLHTSMQSLQKDLPAILAELRAASKEINQLVHKHGKDIGEFTSELPKTVKAGQEFFAEGKKASENLNASVVDNRENLYRALYELRRASENLEAFSDDIRRNPWKLMKEKPEVKPGPRARQEKMEETLLTTGRMGLAPERE